MVTNDDGVDARGIRALAKGLKELKGCRVVVVAPDHEQSAKSHSLTLHRPLRLIKKSKDTYAVTGTPTDAVMMACHIILKKLPDLVVSGINRGANLGDDVHYSGTVSAAMEGGVMGIPAIAISQLGLEKFNYQMAVKFAQKIVRAATKNALPGGIVLNVNVPQNAQTLDFEITKIGKRDYGEICAERVDPRGRPYYWVGGNQFEFEDIADSDCNAIRAGKIAVTPLRVNPTDKQYLNKMRSWQW